MATLTFASSADLTVLNGSLPDGRYSLTIDARKVLDVTGRQMNNATDIVRSAGLFRLFGDLNGDALISKVEDALFDKSKYASASVWAGNYQPLFDFDGQGVIDSPEQYEFKRRVGKRI